MFVGRKEELEFLNEKYNNHKAQMIVLYGRRRIGKTELIKKLISERSGIYYLAEQLPEQLQLKKFSEKVIDFFDEEVITTFDDWEMLFRYLSHKKERFILAIDEFPYLIEKNSGLLSAFQKGWDEYLINSGVFLIISGSSMSVMENSVLGYKSPLYGRRTGQLLLKPFSIQEIDEFFHRRLSFEDLLRIWGTLDGVPFYLHQFDDSKGYYDNVREKVLNPGEVLFSEAEFLLNEELREPRNYFAILRAISLGKRKLGEIINDTGIGKSSIIKYMGVMDMLHLVEREVPVGEDPNKSKKGLYRISDNYFRFFFRYVFYYKDLILMDQQERIIETLKDTESQFFSLTYEDLAKNLLNRISGDFYPEYERWWDRNSEIDLIGINREEKRAIFGEVKWTNKPAGVDVLNSLVTKTRTESWKEFEYHSYIIFSKAGFTSELLRISKDSPEILLVKGIERIC